MDNQSAEMLLDLLGGYGSVTLRKVKFQMSGSFQGRLKESWDIEVALPGYQNESGTRAYIEASGETISKVVDAAYAKLEAYYFSQQSQMDRQRYENNHRFYQERFDTASDNQRSGFDRVLPPAPFMPPIVWGEPRSWDDATEDGPRA